MYGEKTITGDKMIDTQLKEKSEKLNISVDELVERYIKRGLFTDDYYKPPKLSREELMEISKKEIERDRKKGILPKKHDFSVFKNRWSES